MLSPFTLFLSRCPFYASSFQLCAFPPFLLMVCLLHFQFNADYFTSLLSCVSPLTLSLSRFPPCTLFISRFPFRGFPFTLFRSRCSSHVLPFILFRSRFSVHAVPFALSPLSRCCSFPPFPCYSSCHLFSHFVFLDVVTFLFS